MNRGFFTGSEVKGMGMGMVWEEYFLGEFFLIISDFVGGYI
jgi:hypothetical protein